MLNKLVKLCNNRYQNSQCSECTYNKYCPRNCEKCLEYVHYPYKAPAIRKYDCKKMMDFYVCKYAHKYTSELIYAFTHLKDLQKEKYLNVLSIGCGPCTDLLALDYLINNNTFNCHNVDYKGIEINTEIWDDIYNDIRNIVSPNFNFEIINDDICKYIKILLKQDWRPDIIVLQYVLSDINKNFQPCDISLFIELLAHYIDTCKSGTYVICNDINLTVDAMGGREYFDKIFNAMHAQAESHKFHFYNNKNGHYDYGEEYTCNSLIITPYDDLDFYQPYTSCSSAQMIIERK